MPWKKVPPEYTAWRNMLARCRPGRSDADRYFDRGVRVCDRWDPAKGGSYQNFLQDMGPRPSNQHSLDKDGIQPGNLLYGPGLCRWATPSEQMTARRNTVWVTHKGETLSLQQWADRLGVRRSALLRRLRMGWSAEKILETPINRTAGRFAGSAVTVNGETRSIREWSALTGIGHSTIAWRLRHGWPPERAVQHQPEAVTLARG